MPLFHKKPATVEAEQYIGPSMVFLGDPLPKLPAGAEWLVVGEGEHWPVVKWRGQTSHVESGEWVVRGPEGRALILPDHVFRELYTPATP
jgi:hypothetical protein